jgi:hypothetical protein
MMATRKTAEPVQEEAVKEAPAKSGMVRVRNHGRFFLRQPSTGIRIDGQGGVTELKDDAWLDLQISRRLMEKA